MYTLKRDGEQRLKTDREYDIVRYVHSNHVYSVSHAVQHEGYTIELDGVDITSDYILN